MLRYLKIFAVLGLALVLLTTFLVLIGARTSGPAETAALDGLSREAVVQWYEVGARPPRIEAATEEDAARALGFAQSQAMAWRLLLWRQAARGRLAEWYGPYALPADRVARQLALLSGAGKVLPSLPAPDRALIEAFVEGLNAGIATDRVHDDARVTLLGVRPEPFHPADVLAIERLVAWLSAAQSPPPGTERWPDVMAFQAGDARLRSFLQADGLHFSRIWTFADSTDERLVASYVTGMMVRPMFFDAEVVVGGTSRTGVFLPGTPFPVAGAVKAAGADSLRRAWAVYPSSARTWPHATQGKTQRRAERFVVAGGQEWVQVVTTTEAGLLFRSPTSQRRLPPRPVLPQGLASDTTAQVLSDTSRTDPGRAASEAAQRLTALRQFRRADSLWRLDSARAAVPRTLALAWQGYQRGTDAPAWLALWRGEVPTFSLFSNTYLSIPGGGAGARTHRRGFLLADSAHAQALLARLDTLAALVDFPASDMTSTWARTLNRRLVAGLDTARLRHPIEREAATYVRNWSGTFEETSVAATLFTEWLDAEAHLNALSDSSVASDTTFFAAVRRNRAFRTALDTLTRRYGRDLRQWRWGRVVPHLMWFPGYGLPGLDQPSRRRYGPLERPGGGHPTALAYGPEAPGGPVTTYSFDASFRRNAPLRLHRFDFDADRFLARYRLPLSVDPVGVAPQRPTSVTRLTPR